MLTLVTSFLFDVFNDLSGFALSGLGRTMSALIVFLLLLRFSVRIFKRIFN